MKTTAKIVVMSHLSDIEHNPADPDLRLRIEFIKFLILKLKGDLSQEIDADEEFDLYLNRTKITL